MSNATPKKDIAALLKEFGLAPEPPPSSKDADKKRLALAPPDGLTLLRVALRTVAGDPLTRLGRSHHGSVTREDEQGDTKRDVYEAVMSCDVAYFDEVARKSRNRRTRREMLLSTRTLQPKEGRPGEYRPIDMPSEHGRILSNHVFDQIGTAVSKRLTNSMIGFRTPRDVAGSIRLSRGTTIQDVFAMRVQRELRDRPYAVLVDLPDAFGNLPHGVVLAALKEVGLSRRDARYVLDLVTIYAREVNGRIVTSRMTAKGRVGISQGAPLSSLMFNLAFDYLLRRVRAHGPWLSFCYGDDLVLLAKDGNEAQAAFERFRGEAHDLGFTIRGLVTDPSEKSSKGTRIYDTRTEALPLIKSYLVTPKGIDLTGKTRARTETAIEEHKVTSISGARRVIPSKCVSKVFLRRLVEREGIDHGQSRGLTPAATSVFRASAGSENRSGNAKSGALEEREVSLPVYPAGSGDSTSDRIEMETHPTPSCPDTGCTPPAAETMTGGSTLGVDTVSFVDPTASSPGILPGKNQLGRASEGGAPSVGTREPVTRVLMGASRSRHRDAPITLTVTVLEPEHRQTLFEGRRLKVDKLYQGTNLDLSFLGEVPACLQGEVLRQCLRLSSSRGRASVVVPVGALWVAERDLAGAPIISGWKLTSRKYIEGQLVLVFKRNIARRAPPSAAAVRPTADLVIESVGVSRSTAHTYSVTYTLHGTHGQTTEVVPGVFLTATTLLAAARIVASIAPLTVALPVMRGWPAILLDGPNQARRATHPVLFDAMKVLRSWGWKVVDGWLVGARRVCLPTCPEHPRDRPGVRCGAVANSLQDRFPGPTQAGESVRIPERSPARNLSWTRNTPGSF